MPTSNSRCQQFNTGAPPSNSGARPSEARTRPKNIRPIGASRAELHRPRLGVDLLRLERHRPRLEAGCRRSKISSFKSGARLFEARVPPSEGRCRVLEGHARASRAWAWLFQVSPRLKGLLHRQASEAAYIRAGVDLLPTLNWRCLRHGRCQPPGGPERSARRA